MASREIPTQMQGEEVGSERDLLIGREQGGIAEFLVQLLADGLGEQVALEVEPPQRETPPAAHQTAAGILAHSERSVLFVAS